MKLLKPLMLAITAVLFVSCDKQKTAIDENNAVNQQEIDTRKDEVNADAKEAVNRTDANATIDKAQIEANKTSIQAQLDADKKKADADAKAAKARVDAEKR
jgi:hypothetical protein